MSRPPTPLLPPKKDVAMLLLQGPSLFIHLDPRKPHVVVPAWFKKQPQLILQVGLNMANPIPDLNVDDEGISATLSFSRSPFWCRIPWSSVYALVGEDGRGMLWPNEVPSEVAAQLHVRGASPPQQQPRLRAVPNPDGPSAGGGRSEQGKLAEPSKSASAPGRPAVKLVRPAESSASESSDERVDSGNARGEIRSVSAPDADSEGSLTRSSEAAQASATADPAQSSLSAESAHATDAAGGVQSSEAEEGAQASAAEEGGVQTSAAKERGVQASAAEEGGVQTSGDADRVHASDVPGAGEASDGQGAAGADSDQPELADASTASGAREDAPQEQEEGDRTKPGRRPRGHKRINATSRELRPASVSSDEVTAPAGSSDTKKPARTKKGASKSPEAVRPKHAGDASKGASGSVEQSTGEPAAARRHGRRDKLTGTRSRLEAGPAHLSSSSGRASPRPGASSSDSRRGPASPGGARPSSAGGERKPDGVLVGAPPARAPDASGSTRPSVAPGGVGSASSRPAESGNPNPRPKRDLPPYLRVIK